MGWNQDWNWNSLGKEDKKDMNSGEKAGEGNSISQADSQKQPSFANKSESSSGSAKSGIGIEIGTGIGFGIIGWNRICGWD